AGAPRSARRTTLISRPVRMPSSTSERYSARPLRVTALVAAITVNARDVCSRPVSATRFTRSCWIVRGDRLRATAATRSSTLAAGSAVTPPTMLPPIAPTGTRKVLATRPIGPARDAPPLLYAAPGPAPFAGPSTISNLGGKRPVAIATLVSPDRMSSPGGGGSRREVVVGRAHPARTATLARRAPARRITDLASVSTRQWHQVFAERDCSRDARGGGTLRRY